MRSRRPFVALAPGEAEQLCRGKAMPLPVATDEAARPLGARARTGCVVCGRDNPHGLRIRFECRDGGEAIANWTLASAWEGFRGIIHGRVVTTVLDEAMSKAVSETGMEALTAELRIRFRRRVTSGDPFLVRGWVVNWNRRLIRTEAVLVSADGAEHARAWATFLPLPQARKPTAALG